MDVITPVVVSLTEGGATTARAIAAHIGGAHHGRDGRVAQADAHFADAAAHLRALFAAGTPIVAICAAGAVVRALAPMLSDKRREPAVVVVSEDGRSVIPLLGGHHGANALAGRIAAQLGGHAALTTAGDVRLGVALDEPPAGWRLENPEDAKAAAAAMLAGGGADMAGEAADALAPWLAAAPKGDAVAIHATAAPRAGAGLWFRPQRYALGVGCARGCSPEELAALTDAALAEAGISPAALAGVFTLDLKADEGAVIALAARYDAPLRVFSAAELEAQTPRLATPSDVVFAEVGCHGVSEGAALAAVGASGALILPKRKSAMATCALAAADAPITTLGGRSRGRLSVVGIGPGQAEWRTPEVSKLINEAEELVGYGLYIDLLGSLANGKTRSDFPLGGEEDRCRYALERAGEGRDVALICSGDAGIYAMGALVCELLDRTPDHGGVSDAARRAEVVFSPGITALQAASSRVGALIGHDFCAISLSDLLTPRETVKQRVAAAAAGDFVIAFYNPVSIRRRTLLAEARDVLLAHRPAETPVILASSLGRPEETLRARTLGTLEVDEVDMLTVVLIGASQSKVFAHQGGWRAYTPRGYAKKIDSKEGAA